MPLVSKDTASPVVLFPVPLLTGLLMRLNSAQMIHLALLLQQHTQPCLKVPARNLFKTPLSLHCTGKQRSSRTNTSSSSTLLSAPLCLPCWPRWEESHSPCSAEKAHCRVRPVHLHVSSKPLKWQGAKQPDCWIPSPQTLCQHCDSRHLHSPVSKCWTEFIRAEYISTAAFLTSCLTCNVLLFAALRLLCFHDFCFSCAAAEKQLEAKSLVPQVPLL